MLGLQDGTAADRESVSLEDSLDRFCQCIVVYTTHRRHLAAARLERITGAGGSEFILRGGCANSYDDTSVNLAIQCPERTYDRSS